MKARRIGEKDAKKKELFTLYTSSFFKGHFLVTQRVSEGQTIKVQQLSVLMWLPWHTKISATKKKIEDQKREKEPLQHFKGIMLRQQTLQKEEKRGGGTIRWSLARKLIIHSSLPFLEQIHSFSFLSYMTVRFSKKVKNCFFYLEIN